MIFFPRGETYFWCRR